MNSSHALRWGILGTGMIASAFTRDLRLAGLDVRAVGSRTRPAAQAFAAQFELPAAHGSYADLVADDQVDIVYVATPHPFHHPNALLALDAGKHVLVEKPITLNARQAREIADRARARNLLAMEAMWTRWLPHMVRLRSLLAGGAIGEPRALTADHTQALPDDPGHRLNAMDLGGGALLDLGIYPISLSHQLFGAPTTITATASFKPTGADAQVATAFGYRDGQVASTLSSSVAAGANVAMIAGTGGRVEIDRVWYAPADFRVYDTAGTLVESYASDVPGRGMQYQAYEAERLIAAGKRDSDVLPISESVAIMEILDRVRDQIGLRYPGE